jgi:hypothetical protein
VRNIGASEEKRKSSTARAAGRASGLYTPAGRDYLPPTGFVGQTRCDPPRQERAVGVSRPACVQQPYWPALLGHRRPFCPRAPYPSILQHCSSTMPKRSRPRPALFSLVRIVTVTVWAKVWAKVCRASHGSARTPPPSQWSTTSYTTQGSYYCIRTLAPTEPAMLRRRFFPCFCPNSPALYRRWNLLTAPGPQTTPAPPRRGQCRYERAGPSPGLL